MDSHRAAEYGPPRYHSRDDMNHDHPWRYQREGFSMDEYHKTTNREHVADVDPNDQYGHANHHVYHGTHSYWSEYVPTQDRQRFHAYGQTSSAHGATFPGPRTALPQVSPTYTGRDTVQPPRRAPAHRRRRSGSTMPITTPASFSLAPLAIVNFQGTSGNILSTVNFISIMDEESGTFRPRWTKLAQLAQQLAEMHPIDFPFFTGTRALCVSPRVDGDTFGVILSQVSLDHTMGQVVFDGTHPIVFTVMRSPSSTADHSAAEANERVDQPLTDTSAHDIFIKQELDSSDEANTTAQTAPLRDDVPEQGRRSQETRQERGAVHHEGLGAESVEPSSPSTAKPDDIESNVSHLGPAGAGPRASNHRPAEVGHTSDKESDDEWVPKTGRRPVEGDDSSDSEKDDEYVPDDSKHKTLRLKRARQMRRSPSRSQSPVQRKRRKKQAAQQKRTAQGDSSDSLSDRETGSQATQSKPIKDGKVSTRANDDDENEAVNEFIEDEYDEKLEAIKARMAQLNSHAVDQIVAGSKMEHCSQADFENAANFFGIDIATLRKGRLVALPAQWKLSCKFYPYQLVEALVIYRWELSDRNGGILGNMMGMGKTRTMLLVIVIAHVHRKNYIEVTRSREANTCTNHHPINDTSKQCPTAKDRTFHCACESAPSLPQVPQMAPTLISAYNKATSAWLAEIKAMKLLASEWCSDPNDTDTLRFCWMEPTKKDKLEKSLGPPDDKELKEMRVAPDWDARIAQENARCQGRTFVSNFTEHKESPPWRLKWAPESHEGATPHRPAPSAGRFIIICGHTMIKTRVQATFHPLYAIATRDITKNGRTTQETMRMNLFEHAVIWGRVLFDEFHNAKSEGTLVATFYKALRTHNHGYQWKGWALSGTPWEKGSHECLIFISLALVGLQDGNGRSNWHRDGLADGRLEFKNKVYAMIAGLAEKCWSKSRTSDKPRINGLAMARRWKSIFKRAGDAGLGVCKDEDYKLLVERSIAISEHFVLRRSLRTKDPWGRSISGIPGRFEVAFVPCTTPDLLSTIRKAERRRRIVKVGEGCEDSEHLGKFSRHELLAISSYPELATLSAEWWESSGSHNASRFVGGDMQAHLENPKSIMLAQIQRLVKKSAKYTRVVEMVRAHLKAESPNAEYSEEAAKLAREHGKPEPPKTIPNKVLIASVKPATAFITFHGLLNDLDAVKCEYLRGGMPREESDRILGDFKDSKGAKVLALSMCWAEAVTITSGTMIIIMEPQDRQSKQDQMLLRIYRIGQVAEVCLGRILYDPSSPLELAVLNKQVVKTASRTLMQGNEQEKQVVMDENIWKTPGEKPVKIDGLP